VIAMHAVPHLVEAAVRAGREDEIGDPFARYKAWARTASSESGLALLARCEALLEERAPDEAFGDALARSVALSPFQNARTELFYGEWLRRHRRRTEARLHLRAALKLLQGLGAEP
jgi:hypothetical protein